MCTTIATPEAGVPSRFFSHVRPFVQSLLVAAGVALAGIGALAQEVDPPGRVARLNLLQGNVSQLPAGENDWSQAEINRPLTTGDRLRTEPGARVELHSGSTAVRLDGAAALDVGQLDDNTTRLTLSEGTLNLRVRNLYPGEQVEIDTPNLALTVQQPGSFRLEVDPRFGTTRVSARSGAATVYGENAESLPITANGQVLTLAGRNLSQSGLPAPIQTDGFDQWADARDRAEDQSISARYVSRDMPGYQQLDSFGDWQNDATYGAVWLPRVTVAEWAPYRYGQWRWIAPWGWTWVDDAPWGFAPFHYGRWAQIGPRWAWVPGPRVARPTYAPALVGFLGGQPGRADWNVHGGPDRRPGPGIGWFPLAPGEAWRPGFRASPSYLGGVNRGDGRGDRRGNERGQRDGDRPYFFQGRPNAVTAVPQADFGRGPAWRPNRPNLRDGDLAGAQLLQAPPMPAMRPGARPDFGGRRPEQAGNDHPNWNNAARSQAEQNNRAQIQADEARQRQQDALRRPGLERQAQQDRLSQEAQREQVERLQRQQQWQQQQQLQQQQQRDARNQIDPPGPRPQLQQAQQANQQQRDQRFQQERLQREREQAERTQRDQQQRQQFQQQREQQNLAEQQRARQQAQQAQQGEQLRREQQAQQERMQRDVAQREQIQRHQQQQQQQMQQRQQANQVDPPGGRGRVQQAQPDPQGLPAQPGDQARQIHRQQFMNRDQR